MKKLFFEKIEEYTKNGNWIIVSMHYFPTIYNEIIEFLNVNLFFGNIYIYRILNKQKNLKALD